MSAPLSSSPALAVFRQGDRIILPGFATAHSHSFQRALRGRTQRRATGAASFWSWRGLMYALAETLDPERLFHIARFAFIELTMSGITAVGEFHYLHHGPGGTPYANRVELADAVIRAAQAAGIRITLLRTAYFQSGSDEPLTAAQQRFCDPTVDHVLTDVDQLVQRYATDPRIRIGLAAHSIRAVPRAALRALADYARHHQLPFHMHVAEQPGEVEFCQQVYGRRPVELLAEDNIIDHRFTAIHATHLAPHEIKALGDARAFVCICRTTERDLGDGLPNTAALIQAGGRLCVGTDSHASSDAFEEIRAVELDDRSRTLTRHTAAEGPLLLTAATQHGYDALGMGTAWQDDTVSLDATDASLVGLNPQDASLLDGLLFGATPRAVTDVTIAGQPVVQSGRHRHYDEARSGYEAALRHLNLL